MKPFEKTLLGSLDRKHLLDALGRVVDELARNSENVRDIGSRLAAQLQELKRDFLEEK